MPDLSILRTPSPYHIITYGILLGTQTWQSFIGGVVAYRTLPRAQFAQLQEKTFPIYFGIQTALPVILAFTYPGPSNPLGPASGIQGTFDEINKWSVLVPLSTMFLTGLANMLYIGPKTTEVMKLRKHQETRDGKKSYEAGPQSTEMQKLNRSFGTLHGISTLVNLGGLVATLWYGVSLAERLQ